MQVGELKTLAVPKELRDSIALQWELVTPHDKSITSFNAKYSSPWGSCLYGTTKNVNQADAAQSQQAKIGLRHVPAELIDEQKKRIVYTLFKDLFLQVSRL